MVKATDVDTGMDMMTNRLKSTICDVRRTEPCARFIFKKLYV